MRRAKAVVDAVLGALLALLMGLAVVNVVWQVISRYLVGRASPYTEELARFLLIWIGLLGSAYVMGRGMHLAIDLLPRALGPAGRRKLDVVIGAAMLLFAVSVLVVGGWELVSERLYLQQRSPALGLRMGHVYLAAPISGALMCFYAAVQIVCGSEPQENAAA